MSHEDRAEFHHVYVPGTTGRTVLLLHGTGGSEQSLLALGAEIAPDAALLSPRGKILEHGQPRFFRRLAEGVFDEEDLVRRTHELADFVRASSARHALDARRIYALGYSNGANIAGSLLLLQPGLLAGAALLRPMVPLTPETLPDLAGTAVFLAAGKHDPIVPQENARRLAKLLGDAGALVTQQWDEAGHELTESTISSVSRWFTALAR